MKYKKPTRKVIMELMKDGFQRGVLRLTDCGHLEVTTVSGSVLRLNSNYYTTPADKKIVFHHYPVQKLDDDSRYRELLNSRYSITVTTLVEGKAPMEEASIDVFIGHNDVNEIFDMFSAQEKQAEKELPDFPL